MEYQKKLVDHVSEAILKGDGKLLHEYAYDLESTLIAHDNFPQLLFDSVLSILKSPEFQKMQDSVYLLNNLFKPHLELLSDLQKAEFLTVLEMIYGSLADSTTCLIVTEIIVDLFFDERSLSVLCRLKKVRAEMPRALLPNGFVYFVKECHNEALSKRAYEELIQMKNDPSEVVKNEVEESLLRIKKTRRKDN